MNITRDKRILRYINKKYGNGSIYKYFEYLLPLASCSGKINNYFSIHSSLKDILYNGSATELSETYILLLNDGLIKLSGTTLIINCYSLSVLSQLEDELRFNSTRPYRKQMEGQQELSDILKPWNNVSNKVGIDPNEINASISERILGVKCPRYFLPYLSGKPLKSDEINSLAPDALLNEEARRNLTDECIMLLIAYLAICKGDGVIYDFNTYAVSKYIIDNVFDGKTKCLSTMYLCHDRLIELGFVRSISDGGLEIVNYKESFGKNKNYVVIPYVVFKRKFKKLRIGSKRLFFEWIFMLNNGEDGNQNIGAKKKIYYRAYTTEWNTPKEKEKYKSVLVWLRKRCRAEIKDLICSEDDFTDLNQIFNITINNTGSLCISIRENYYISKRYERKLRMSFDAVDRFKRKSEYIRKMLLSHCTFTFTDHDLSSFTQILKHESNHVIKYILKNLEIIYKTKKEFKGKPINSLPGYLAAIYNKYKSVGNLEWNPEV